MLIFNCTFTRFQPKKLGLSKLEKLDYKVYANNIAVLREVLYFRSLVLSRLITVNISLGLKIAIHFCSHLCTY